MGPGADAWGYPTERSLSRGPFDRLSDLMVFFIESRRYHDHGLEFERGRFKVTRWYYRNTPNIRRSIGVRILFPSRRSRTPRGGGALGRRRMRV